MQDFSTAVPAGTDGLAASRGRPNEVIAIGRSTLLSSRIGLGTWAIGGSMWGGSDVDQSIRTIHAALDRGITLIDTAPVYGFGQAEEIVGRALAEDGRRDRVLIASKVGLDWRDGSVHRDSRPARIRVEIEASLRRLKTDRIDLYQVHWPDPSVPMAETAGALGDLLNEGKIRAIGVSNFGPAEMAAFGGAAPTASVQSPYNLFERAIEADIMPYAHEHGLTILAYGALCRGLLSGRITEDTRFGGDDLRRNDPKFLAPRRRQYLAAVAKLDAFAQQSYGRNVLALAVRWILDRPGTIALWGARRPAQLDALEGIFGWSIDQSSGAEIDRILAETIVDPVGPEFMAPQERSAA